MDLWLPPHDFRLRSLKTLTYSFGSSPISPLSDCVAVTSGCHLLSFRFSDDPEKTFAELRAAWPSVQLQPDNTNGMMVNRIFHHPEQIPVLAVGTPFQLTIWEFLRTIPSASTLTYGEVAHAIGHPKAARAVGRAVGANGIAVVIPCHRIVSRKSLTGYRWGLERKKQLLAWELARRDPLKMPF